MRKLFFSLLVLFISTSLLYAVEGEKYGTDLSLDKKTKVSEILDAPENFVGKKVQIEGTIVNVCEKRGCWIEIASDKEYQTIKVKVNDGEIVFPMEVKGKNAVVEGEVYAIESESSDCSGSCGDKAEMTEAKEGGCCSSSHKVTKVYQIKGLGAVIQ